MAGETGCVDEARHLLCLADQRVVVGSGLVEAMPSTGDADLEQGGCAVGHHPLPRPPANRVASARRIQRVGRGRPCRTTDRTFGVEVEAGREVYCHRHSRRTVGHRLRIPDRAGDGIHGEIDAAHCRDRRRPEPAAQITVDVDTVPRGVCTAVRSPPSTSIAVTGHPVANVTPIALAAVA